MALLLWVDDATLQLEALRYTCTPHGDVPSGRRLIGDAFRFLSFGRPCNHLAKLIDPDACHPPASEITKTTFSFRILSVEAELRRNVTAQTMQMMGRYKKDAGFSNGAAVEDLVSGSISGDYFERLPIKLKRNISSQLHSRCRAERTPVSGLVFTMKKKGCIGRPPP